jgi:hypothetical protein
MLTFTCLQLLIQANYSLSLLIVAILLLRACHSTDYINTTIITLLSHVRFDASLALRHGGVCSPTSLDCTSVVCLLA